VCVYYYAVITIKSSKITSETEIVNILYVAFERLNTNRKVGN